MYTHKVLTFRWLRDYNVSRRKRNMEAVREKFRLWLAEHQCTRARAAGLIGTSRLTLYRWERKEEELSADVQAKLFQLMLNPPPNGKTLVGGEPVFFSFLCPSCKAPTVDPDNGGLYCHRCGSPLIIKCPKCGTIETRTGASFCWACGHSLIRIDKRAIAVGSNGVKRRKGNAARKSSS